MPASDLLPVDSTRFRAVMGAFATGVAVITTAWRGAHHGMTVNALTSVSLDPCLLLVCTKHGSTTGTAIKARGEFAINLLARPQQEISRRFVGAIADRFAGLDLSFSESGLPLLPGCLAHLCCIVRSVHMAGDHDIVLGEVVSAREAAGEPLVFYRGAFGSYRADTRA